MQTSDTTNGGRKPADTMRSGGNGVLDRLDKRLEEAYDALWDNFVDPHEDFFDPDGTRWIRVGTETGPATATADAIPDEQAHREIRARCRALALTNEFAISGHENRISFIVGSGHIYRATAAKGHEVADELPARVQSVIDEFIRQNQWFRRQQEIVRRRDRDGEAFLRFFPQADGTLRVRFVEPGQVTTPAERVRNPAASFGILTEPDDVEAVVGYFVDGEFVDAAEIQHRKANVDSNVKRGVPLFYPVHENLRRAERLLRNMSVVAQVQSAIALVRKHRSGSRSTVEQFAADRADVRLTDPVSGKTTNVVRYGPGTILDAHAGVDYDFPAARINAASFVKLLQAELRAVASRLVMPEFMLTSDASNANYASTLVAEGPAVKMFQRVQAEQIADDLEVMWRAVRVAIDAGRLPPEALELVEIQASGPRIAVRDRLEEARVAQIELDHGILSPQSWSGQSGLDYDQEQTNIDAHRRRVDTARG